MKRTCMGLATMLAFAVFGTAAALAQPAKPDVNIDDERNVKYNISVDVNVQEGDVQEEVEILRRLLDKSFTAVYGPLSAPVGPIFSGSMGGPMPGMGYMMGVMRPDSYRSAERPAPDLEGVYLKDYGVVYTVALPPPPNNMLPGPTVRVVTQTPLSPWERTRKELRGEKTDVSRPVGASPPLSEVILKVLADNGKHFTRLAEAERITVAVTFRDDDANGVYRPHPTGIWQQNLPPNAYLYQTEPGVSSGGGLAPSGSAAPPTPALGPPGMGSPGSPMSKTHPHWTDNEPSMTDINNDLLLGNLHVKQKKYSEAIAAFQKVQAQVERAIDRAQNALQLEDVPDLLTAANIFNQLAKGYAAAGDDTASQKAIEHMARLAKTAEELTGKTPEAKAKPPSPPALPSKLIVTASKKLMDEVGSGKTTFEAFTKAATVEYVKPSADKK